MSAKSDTSNNSTNIASYQRQTTASARRVREKTSLISNNRPSTASTKAGQLRNKNNFDNDTLKEVSADFNDQDQEENPEKQAPSPHRMYRRDTHLNSDKLYKDRLK
jgi:hypothetical protein